MGSPTGGQWICVPFGLKLLLRLEEWAKRTRKEYPKGNIAIEGCMAVRAKPDQVRSVVDLNLRHESSLNINFELWSLSKCTTRGKTRALYQLGIAFFDDMCYLPALSCIRIAEPAFGVIVFFDTINGAGRGTAWGLSARHGDVQSIRW